MGAFNYQEADNYGSNGSGGSFFKIENDMEVKRVRLLGRDMNDFPGYACHQIELDGKRKLVNCLREYNEPASVCPFCASRDSSIRKQIAKWFIPLYNVDEEEVQIWERGKSFLPILASYVSRHKNVVNTITEVERHGKPRDTNTTYMLYPAEEQDPEDVKLEDFEEDIPEVIGRYILDKTAEDMEYYLENGEFESSGDDAPVRRRSRSNDDEPVVRRRTSRRRTDEEEF